MLTILCCERPPPPKALLFGSPTDCLELPHTAATGCKQPLGNAWVLKVSGVSQRALDGHHSRQTSNRAGEQ